MSRPPNPDQEPLKPSVRLTGRGAVLLIICLAGVMGGAYWNEVSAVTVGLTGILVTLAAWPVARLNLSGLSCERRVPECAFAGQLFPMDLVLRNGKRRMDTVGVEYEDGIAGPGERGLFAAWVPAAGEVVRSFSTRMLRRGTRHRLRSALTSSFPFGLWRGKLDLRDTLEMIIFPRAIPPRELEDPQDMAQLEADESESAKHDWLGDFHGIREFQPGDRLKLIHWPSTARSGKIMVREFDRRLPEKYLILFHSIRPGRARGEHGDSFEGAMELLCGLLQQCRDEGVPIELIASFRQWQRFPVPNPAFIEDALRLLAAARRTPESDAANLHRALATVETGARVFVLSDVPVKEWEDLVPPLPFAVTCLSVVDLRIKRPGLVLNTPRPAPAPVS